MLGWGLYMGRIMRNSSPWGVVGSQMDSRSGSGLAVQASEIGAWFGDPDLSALAKLGHGQALINYSGEPRSRERSGNASACILRRNGAEEFPDERHDPDIK